jgi:dienelactone hydrolase
MRRGGLLRGVLAVPLLLAAVVGCSGDDGPDATASTAEDETAAQPSVGPPFAVATLTEDLVDVTRPTDGLPERPLETTVRYPDADGGPFPLIVFAHGFIDHPNEFTELTTTWAEAGYVVAAPAFPSTRVDAAGGPDAADLPNQPADVRFVIDEVARLAEGAGHELAGRVDLERVGVAGHGLGVTTVLAPTFHSCCRDDRIDAALALSGVLIDLDGAYQFSATPLMVLFGDADEFLQPTTGTDLYERAQAPKLLMTIIGGTHYQPYRDGTDPADETVAVATTRFWDHYLAGDAALDDLLSAAAVDGATTLEHDL